MSDKPVGRGNGEGSKATQIKPGEKRSKGRPKGATGRRSDWEREMRRKVTVIEKGKELRISMRQLMYRGAIIKAAKDAKFFEQVRNQDDTFDTEARHEAYRLKRINARILFGLDKHFEYLNEEDKIELYRKIDAGEFHEYRPPEDD